MRRQRIDRVSGRLADLQGNVAGRLGHGLEDVGRRIEEIGGDVIDLRREIAASLPAETVTALVKGSVIFLRAAAITIVVAGVIIGLTTQLDDDTWLSFLAPHKTKLIVVEVGLFGVLSVELLVRSVSQYLRSRNAQQAAFVVRVSVRAACYAILTVSLVSLLAASPSLAIGVGSVTGLIIGLSAQATVGNAISGMVIAIARPFRIGDEITVMGVTGTVVEIAVMHTVLDTTDRLILVPSSTLMTQVVQRAKEGRRTGTSTSPNATAPTGQAQADAAGGVPVVMPDDGGP
jgi:small-conductance mechanosensitive channel